MEKFLSSNNSNFKTQALKSKVVGSYMLYMH